MTTARAHRMTALLREACRPVNVSTTKVLTEAEYRRIRKRYRTILTQGFKEMSDILRRPNGRRGRMAKSDAHNL